MSKVRFTSVSFCRKDKFFYVELGMLFVCEDVRDDDAFLFTPKLVGRDCHKELLSVMLVGESRYWALRSAIRRLEKDVLYSYKISKVLKAVNGQLISYSYRICVDYEDWMSGAKIDL